MNNISFLNILCVVLFAQYYQLIRELECKVKCNDSELNNTFLEKRKYPKEFKNTEPLIRKFIYLKSNSTSISK